MYRLQKIKKSKSESEDKLSFSSYRWLILPASGAIFIFFKLIWGPVIIIWIIRHMISLRYPSWPVVGTLIFLLCIFDLTNTSVTFMELMNGVFQSYLDFFVKYVHRWHLGILQDQGGSCSIFEDWTPAIEGREAICQLLKVWVLDWFGCIFGTCGVQWGYSSGSNEDWVF